MNRIIKLLFLVCISVFVCSAQSNSYSLPIKWETYKVSEKNVSVLMPKLPILIGDSSKNCKGEATSQYIAYADDTIYVLRVTSKTEPYKYCTEKRKFSEKNFQERLTEIRLTNGFEKDSPQETKNANFYKFTGNEWINIVQDDFQNKRWFELIVYGENLNKPEISKFLDSLKIENNPSGIEIGSGANRVYGDEKISDDSSDSVSDNSVKTDEKNKTENAKPLRLYFKPRANYTDAARNGDVQGVVRLRVMFLANGGIGRIDVISALPLGLTEQAIAAAAKIVFRPAQRNNVKFSVSRTVEYNFALY